MNWGRHIQSMAIGTSGYLHRLVENQVKDNLGEVHYCWEIKSRTSPMFCEASSPSLMTSSAFRKIELITVSASRHIFVQRFRLSVDLAKSPPASRSRACRTSRGDLGLQNRPTWCVVPGLRRPEPIPEFQNTRGGELSPVHNLLFLEGFKEDNCTAVHWHHLEPR